MLPEKLVGKKVRIVKDCGNICKWMFGKEATVIGIYKKAEYIALEFEEEFRGYDGLHSQHSKRGLGRNVTQEEIELVDIYGETIRAHNERMREHGEIY